MIVETRWFGPLSSLFARAKAEVRYHLLRKLLDWTHKFLADVPREVCREPFERMWVDHPEFGDGMKKLREILGKRITTKDEALLEIIESAGASVRGRMN